VTVGVLHVLTPVAFPVRRSRSELNCDSPVVTFGCLAMSCHLSDYGLCYLRRPGDGASVIQACPLGSYEKPVCNGVLNNARMLLLQHV
jgi:hypothetical protein